MKISPWHENAGKVYDMDGRLISYPHNRDEAVLIAKLPELLEALRLLVADVRETLDMRISRDTCELLDSLADIELGEKETYRESCKFKMRIAAWPGWKICDQDGSVAVGGKVYCPAHAEVVKLNKPAPVEAKPPEVPPVAPEKGKPWEEWEYMLPTNTMPCHVKLRRKVQL